MKRILLIGVMFLVVGCVMQNNYETNAPLEDENAVVSVCNLDFAPEQIWLAARRAIRGYFESRPEHKSENFNDLDWCYPVGYEETKHKALRPYKIIKTWTVFITPEVPEIGRQTARRITLKIIPDGESAWQCRILVEKCARATLPLKDREAGWISEPQADMNAANDICKRLHSELQKIQEHLRLGIVEKEY